MCLEESFCPFIRDALNFWQPKIYTAPHHPAVFMFPLSLSRHHCAVWRSALSFCSVTTHAHRKNRVRSNNAPTRKVYVTLVHLLLFAVELLCCDMQYSWSGQRYALLTFADNTCLLDVSLHQIIISIHFPLIYAIWWPLTHITRSYLYMKEWQIRAFSFSTRVLQCVCVCDVW